MILPTLTVLASTLLAQPQPVNVCDSAVIQQTRAAIEQLRASPQVIGSARTAVYEGTMAIEAHMAQPHQLRTLPLRIELALDRDCLAIREVSGSKVQELETTLIVGERVATQPSSDAPFKELTGAEAVAAMAAGRRWLPHTTIAAALAAGPSLRPGPAIEMGQQSLSPLTFAPPDGRACTLLLDDQGRVRHIESLSADQRLGDVCEWTAFNYELQAGVPADLPTRLDRFMVLGGITVKYSLKLASAGDAGTTRDYFDLPADRKADIPTWTTSPVLPASSITIREIADGLFVADVPAANERVMVIERESDLVLLEAPDGDATCGELLRALSDRFPGKKVGLVAFGHHHPSYTGGLRALAAQGATIVSPRELESFVRLVLARPTTLGGPAIAAPPETRVVCFDAEYTIEAGDNSVHLYDIGQGSRHTDQYIIFYFATRTLLFEGDLGYFPSQGAARINPRLTGLVGAVQVRGIKPGRVVQAWPLKGTLAEVYWDTIEALVKAEAERVRAATAGEPAKR